eukprot:g18290.t1
MIFPIGTTVVFIASVYKGDGIFVDERKTGVIVAYDNWLEDYSIQAKDNGWWYERKHGEFDVNEPESEAEPAN